MRETWTPPSVAARSLIVSVRRVLRRLFLGLATLLFLVAMVAGIAWIYFHPHADRSPSIAYGQRHGTTLAYEIVRPREPNGIAILLMVSGGWKSKPSGSIPVWMMAPVLRRGYTVVPVYHLSQPQATVSEIVADMHRAVRHFRHHALEYGLDPERLGVTGGSAGGHLSLMLATTGGPGPANAPDPIDRNSSAVQAVAIFYPVTDLLDLGTSTENLGDGGPPKSFLKAFGPTVTNLTAWKEIGHSLSPRRLVHTNLPPTLIFHGDADTLTPLEQSEWYQADARDLGQTVDIRVHPRGQHGWPTMLLDLRHFADWFDRHLLHLPPPIATQRAATRQAFHEVAGTFPRPHDRGNPRLVIVHSVDLGEVWRHEVIYHPDPGESVPAFLVVPKSATPENPAPAAIALHQTHPGGRHVVVGLEGTADDPYALELALRGWVVFAPPYPLLADYHPNLHELGYASGALKGVWNNIRALDALERLPYVRTQSGFASIGHSLGGHHGLFTALLDERIRAVVTSCGFDAFPDYYGGDPERWAPGQGWCQTRYFPALAQYQHRLNTLPFDFPQILSAIAPRGVFVSAPLGDANFRWESVARVIAEVAPAFALLGAASHLTVLHPDTDHRFPPEIRLQAYDFLEYHLGQP